jgi:hypothetical protein
VIILVDARSVIVAGKLSFYLSIQIALSLKNELSGEVQQLRYQEKGLGSDIDDTDYFDFSHV